MGGNRERPEALTAEDFIGSGLATEAKQDDEITVLDAIGSQNAQIAANTDPSVVHLQNLSQIGGVGVFLGDRPMSESLAVVIANDQTLPVTQAEGTPKTGQIVVAAGPTATPLAGVSTPAKGVIVLANSANAGTIYLGTATVTSITGLRLAPGAAASLDAVDLNDVYINGTAGEGVSFFALI